MNSSAFHLNLLKETEKLSSSPVRLRVMLPIGTLLAVIGMLLWWGILFTQLLVVKSELQSVNTDLAAKNKAHAEIIEKMNLVRELRLQLEQLDYYKAGVRAAGEPLAHLAEVMPLRVQLTELAITEPPPMILTPPKGVKGPTLFGPTNNFEVQTIVLSGRTTKETPVVSMMESIESPDFETLFTREKKINTFKQDTAEIDGRKLLSFEIEYTMPERRFAK